MVGLDMKGYQIFPVQASDGQGGLRIAKRSEMDLYTGMSAYPAVYRVYRS